MAHREEQSLITYAMLASVFVFSVSEPGTIDYTLAAAATAAAWAVNLKTTTDKLGLISSKTDLVLLQVSAATSLTSGAVRDRLVGDMLISSNML